MFNSLPDGCLAEKDFNNVKAEISSGARLEMLLTVTHPAAGTGEKPIQDWPAAPSLCPHKRRALLVISTLPGREQAAGVPSSIDGRHRQRTVLHRWKPTAVEWLTHRRESSVLVWPESLECV